MFEIKTYAKKPVAIAAVHFTDSEDIAQIRNWIGMEISDWRLYPAQNRVVIFINTLEGTMAADVGDYIIKGVKGEFYPCKPDIFEQTYEELNEDENHKTHKDC